MEPKEQIEAQRVLCSQLGAMCNSVGYQEFARLVNEGRASRVSSLINSKHDQLTHQLQGEILAIDWLLSIPSRQFDKLKQMDEAEAKSKEDERG
jgi:hypothetical protein